LPGITPETTSQGTREYKFQSSEKLGKHR